MTKTARKKHMFLAVFLMLIQLSLLTAYQSQETDTDNTSAIPALMPAQEPKTTAYVQPEPYVVSDHQYRDLDHPHRLYFVPTSKFKPSLESLSIPIKDTRKTDFFDLNEWEEKRFFSSNLTLDSSFYTSGSSGNKNLSSKDDGSFYSTNFRYELFSSQASGNSLSVTLDTTHTNDQRREYLDNFNLNQINIDAKSNNSAVSFGHTFPHFSQYSMNQNLLGIYAYKNFDKTRISAFTGYHAMEKDELKNPRISSGLRLENIANDSIQLGLNLVITEDKRDNAGATFQQPSVANNLVSLDAKIKANENIFVSTEIARSDTDYDKRESTGKVTGGSYRFSSGYERKRFLLEAGIEKADTSFLTLMGSSLRDERSDFARLSYEMNEYISTNIEHRTSRNNVDQTFDSTLVRRQPEFQLIVTPSSYYKDLQFDFFYKPIHEFTENTNIVDRHIEIMKIQFNQTAGDMSYQATLNQTIDRDQILSLNDKDIHKWDFKLSWKYDYFTSAYTSFGYEKLTRRRIGTGEDLKFFGFGGSSRFRQHVFVDLDYLREEVTPRFTNFDSVHDRISTSLTREYSHLTRLIVSLEASKNQFGDSSFNYDDYTAKVRLIKAF